jgi:hypothetical protein
LKDGFYLIDFQQNQDLIDLLDDFIENEIKNYNVSKSKMLANLLKNPIIEFNLFSQKINDKSKKNQKNVILF